jgi:UDP-N-acetylmuramate-alanine ligase
MTAEELAREIRDPPARYAGGVDQAARTVADALRPGDVFFTIGAGDVDAVGPVLLELLEQR